MVQNNIHVRLFVNFSFKRQECVEIYYTTGDNVHVYALSNDLNAHKHIHTCVVLTYYITLQV